MQCHIEGGTLLHAALTSCDKVYEDASDFKHGPSYFKSSSLLQHMADSCVLFCFPLMDDMIMGVSSQMSVPLRCLFVAAQDGLMRAFPLLDDIIMGVSSQISVLLRCLLAAAHGGLRALQIDVRG